MDREVIWSILFARGDRALIERVAAANPERMNFMSRQYGGLPPEAWAWRQLRYLPMR